MQRRIGSYVVERTLGAGSFATVLLAHDELLDDRVAIKVLAENWSNNPDVRRRFTEEARILRRIDHDRVIRVHSIDQTDDGRPYFVMSWADAGTLRDVMDDQVAAGQPFSEASIAAYGREMLESLSVVHDFGAVHRDIKPSNVLFRTVTDHQRLSAARVGRTLGPVAMVLGDFGLAKDLALASGFTVAAGTPAYMAPEQANTSATIDHRADLYSVAAVLYEMTTGRPPFGAVDLAGVRAQGTRSVSGLDQLDVSLRTVIERGLQFDASDRWNDTDEMIRALPSNLKSTSPESGRATAQAPESEKAAKALAARRANGDFRLPDPFVQEFDRFLLNSGPERFGLPSDACDDDQRTAAVALTDRWRRLVNTGRIPFTARSAAEEFIRLVEGTHGN